MSWRRGKSYAQDLRDQVFALADDGLGVTATARQLRVTPSYVSKVLSRRRATGETTARRPDCASGALALRLSLLIHGILAALRQIFHLSACPNLPGHLSRPEPRPR
jgi:'Paired box' domain